MDQHIGDKKAKKMEEKINRKEVGSLTNKDNKTIDSRVRIAKKPL